MKDIFEGVLAPFFGGFIKLMNRGVDRDGKGKLASFYKIRGGWMGHPEISILNGLLGRFGELEEGKEEISLIKRGRWSNLVQA